LSEQTRISGVFMPGALGMGIVHGISDFFLLVVMMMVMVN
jgi:hypothetical protein